MKLSDLLSSKFKISKRLSKKYIKAGKVEVNNKIMSKDIDIGEENEINFLVDKKIENFDYNEFLIAEYDSVIFLYKPPFMHTERLKLEDGLTISDIVEKKFPNCQLISRLDYETDGIIPAISSNLNINFIKKEYLALVHGVLEKEVTLFNKIDARKRKKVKVCNELVSDPTVIKPIRFYEKFTLVKVEVKEATRHQIRALLSFIDYPIVGDKLYGIQDNSYRLMLRCQKIYLNQIVCSSIKLKMFMRQIKLNITHSE